MINHLTFLAVSVLATVASAGAGAQTGQKHQCDVVITVINGGSTAAFSSALIAAAEGAHVCLLEPTDWVGGQMTANGVPALDFTPEGYPVPFGKTHDTQRANMPSTFWAILQKLDELVPSSPSFFTCWVSPYCYLPSQMVADILWPMLRSPHLRALEVFTNTVPRAVRMDATGRRIVALSAVQRTPRDSCSGFVDRLSHTLADWYSPENSTRFTKTLHEFLAPVFLETSYTADLLVLTNASYLQGMEERFDGDTSGIGNSTLGQSSEMTMHVEMLQTAAPLPPNPYPPVDPSWVYDMQMGFNLTWPELWTRRRSFHSAASPLPPQEPSTPAAAAPPGHRHRPLQMHPPPVNNVSAGDISLMAWLDYHDDYVLLSRNSSQAQAAAGTWAGGINVQVVEAMERFSMGGFYALNRAAPTGFANHTRVNSTALGTCNGLARLPYIRDTRRSIGLDDFLLNLSALAPAGSGATARRPPDTVAIGYHGVDIWGHRLVRYQDLYPAYVQQSYHIAPAYLPLRAMTNRDIDNLLVAGLPMAQSVMVSSALRMHPIEYAAGCSAGAAAAVMAASGAASTRELLDHHLGAVQDAASRHGPLEWTL